MRFSKCHSVLTVPDPKSASETFDKSNAAEDAAEVCRDAALHLACVDHAGTGADACQDMLH